MPGGGLQPHRKGSDLRPVGGMQMRAMLRGKTLQGTNPSHQGAQAPTGRPKGRQARRGRAARPARG